MYLSNALLEEEERTKALRVLQETSGFKSRSYLNRARWIGAQLPGMRGLVPRYTHIRYRGLDAEGKPVDRKADGFHHTIRSPLRGSGESDGLKRPSVATVA